MSRILKTFERRRSNGGAGGLALRRDSIPYSKTSLRQGQPSPLLGSAATKKPNFDNHRYYQANEDMNLVLVDFFPHGLSL